jgi:hypothetical protein
MLSKEDRKAIEAAIASVEAAIESINEIAAEQQELYDAMSEKVQEGAKGEALSELLGFLEEATTGMESGKDALYGALDVGGK